MKKLLFLLIAGVLFCGLSAWATTQTISFGADTILPGSLAPPFQFAAEGGTMGCDGFSGASMSCGAAAFTLNFDAGPTALPCNAQELSGGCSSESGIASGAPLTLTYNGGTITGAPDQLPTGVVLSATALGGTSSASFGPGQSSWANNATLEVTYIDPALLADLGITGPTGTWGGTYSGTAFQSPTEDGTSFAVQLTDPPPTPAPEPSAFVLLAIGLAAMGTGVSLRRRCSGGL